MKELTKELKARFFAQYWGQEVRGTDLMQFNEYVSNLNDIESDCALWLKKLSSITDEDAIEVAKIEGIFIDREDALLRGRNLVNWLYVTNWETEPITVINIHQHLQSKGYALPFMGISVEQMIEAGWIKLFES